MWVKSQPAAFRCHLFSWKCRALHMCSNRCQNVGPIWDCRKFYGTKELWIELHFISKVFQVRRQAPGQKNARVRAKAVAQGPVPHQRGFSGKPHFTFNTHCNMFLQGKEVKVVKGVVNMIQFLTLLSFKGSLPNAFFACVFSNERTLKISDTTELLGRQWM